MSPILLDTHAAIWSADGTLPRKLCALIDDAADRNELLLSPISAWEIGMLVARRRLTLSTSLHDYVRALFERSGAVVAALTPSIAASAAALPGEAPADPADRVLIATAAAYGARLITRDKSILAYARSARNPRCIAC